MNIQEKINNLSKLEDTVLYKWSAGQRRIAGDYILLSDLRLNVLTCSNGTLQYSAAAPILYIDRGTPVIQFRDNDVMNIIDGSRKGINIRAKFAKEGETAVVARHCEHRIVKAEDVLPKYIETKIMSIGNSPAYPVSFIVLPQLMRISAKPETLVPLIGPKLFEAIGHEKNETVDSIIKRFRENLDMFGTYTDDGFVISNDYVATGGCVVAASRGITARSGSCVFEMTKRAFYADVDRKHWEITKEEK